MENGTPGGAVGSVLFDLISGQMFRILSVLSVLLALVGMLSAFDLPREVDDPEGESQASGKGFLFLVNGIAFIFWLLVFPFLFW